MASVIRGSGASTLGGNVNVQGVLTYEDVTSVDSVGIVTARSGIRIPSGSLGIGLSNPDAKFQVNGNAVIGTDNVGLVEFTSTGVPHFAIGANASSYRSTRINVVNGGGWADLSFDAIDVAPKSGLPSAGSLAANIMYLDASTRNVGIGTDNPTFELDLRKTGQADLLIGSYNAGGARLMLDGDSDGDGSGGDFCEIMADTSGDLTINARNPASDANMIFKVGGGTEKLRIESDGKVGIGTDSISDFVDILYGQDSDNIVVVRGADNTSEYAAIGVNGGNAIITGGGAGTTSAGLIFRTAASGTEAKKLHITSSGEIISTNAFKYVDDIDNPHFRGTLTFSVRSRSTQTNRTIATLSNLNSQTMAIAKITWVGIYNYAGSNLGGGECYAFTRRTANNTGWAANNDNWTFNQQNGSAARPVIEWNNGDLQYDSGGSQEGELRVEITYRWCTVTPDLS